MEKTVYIPALLLGLALVMCSACTPVVQEIQVVSPPEERIILRTVWSVPLGEETALIEFKKLVTRVPLGKEVGTIAKGPNPLPFLWERGDWAYCHNAFAGLVYQQLKQANYSVTGNPNALFDDLFEKTSEFLIGASIVDVEQSGVRTAQNTVRVRTQLKIQWQVFSRRHSRVVFQTETEGTRWTQVDDSVLTYADLYADLLQDAVQGLLADEGFYALVTKKNRAPAGNETPMAHEPIVLPKLAASAKTLQASIAGCRASVVTIIRGDGHGSGFFINRDGYLLTNHHVVGDDRMVTVRLATGREMIAEVVRVDADHDVALAKLEVGRMPALPIQQQSVNIGEDVYAMGTPLDRKLSTSLSKGIVSGFRETNGCRYVQSDVNILPGSSGGPLLDAHGNVVGISSQLVTYGAAPSGISLFIPIQDALDALKIDLKDASRATDESEALPAVHSGSLTGKPRP